MLFLCLCAIIIKYILVKKDVFNLKGKFMKLANSISYLKLAKIIPRKGVISLLVISLFFELGLPSLAFAGQEGGQYVQSAGFSLFESRNKTREYEILARNEKLVMPKEGEQGFLPLESDEPRVSSERWITATAYSSTRDQTDATPFTTAWQTPVRDGIVALNFLPKGSMVRFPDQFGDKIFIVEDRMNVRYPYRADIWMPTREEAIQFGIKYIRLQVLAPRVDRDYVLNNFEPHWEGGNEISLK